MITYALAVQLKKAGFPPPEPHTNGDYDSWTLKETYGLAYYKARSDGLINEIRLFPGYSYNRDLVYAPTLVELIGECGDKFHKLEQNNNAGDRWSAYEFRMNDEWKDGEFRYCVGSTPEEAVTSLYIKLNQK